MSSLSDFLSMFTFVPSVWLFCSSWSTCILFFTKHKNKYICYINNEAMHHLQKLCTIFYQNKCHTSAASHRPFSHAFFNQLGLDLPQFFLFSRAHISVLSHPGFHKVYCKSLLSGRAGITSSSLVAISVSMGSSPSVVFRTSTREALDTLNTPCTFTRTFTFTFEHSPDA